MSNAMQKQILIHNVPCRKYKRIKAMHDAGMTPLEISKYVKDVLLYLGVSPNQHIYPPKQPATRQKPVIVHKGFIPNPTWVAKYALGARMKRAGNGYTLDGKHRTLEAIYEEANKVLAARGEPLIERTHH